jgi:mannose-1-phosphate guanylyltransferase/mannose-6-phosphate isomerase
MTDLIVPLIMCGGAGTRLWPASREGLPKQFLQLFGRFSTFQDTVWRVSDPTLFGRPIIISNSQYRFLIAEQLADIGTEADILLEPARRDSGPAIAAGAAFALGRGGDPVMVALAADHVVTDPASFVAACQTAREAAQAGHLVTFGVRPDRPATEYGYIRPGAAAGPGLFAVDKFVEKPNEETAARYVAEGFLWNSGNFMFRAGSLLEEYRKFEPQSALAVAAAVAQAGTDLGFVNPGCAGIRTGAGGLNRLCDHGEDHARGRDTGLVRLVGRGIMALGVGSHGEGFVRQCGARPCSLRRRQQLLRRLG